MTDETAGIDGLRQQLSPLRGLWPGFEADLKVMGFACLQDVRECEISRLMERYGSLTGRAADAVVQATFTSVVRFAETGVPTPWWRIWREQLIGERDRLVAMR